MEDEMASPCRRSPGGRRHLPYRQGLPAAPVANIFVREEAGVAVIRARQPDEMDRVQSGLDPVREPLEIRPIEAPSPHPSAAFLNIAAPRCMRRGADSIRLNPALDIEELAQLYAAKQRLQVRNILEEESAEHIYKLLAEQTPWWVAFNEGEKVHQLPPEQVRSLTPQQVAEMMRGHPATRPQAISIPLRILSALLEIFRSRMRSGCRSMTPMSSSTASR